jgi:hypothetical protein
MRPSAGRPWDSCPVRTLAAGQRQGREALGHAAGPLGLRAPARWCAFDNRIGGERCTRGLSSLPQQALRDPRAGSATRLRMRFMSTESPLSIGRRGDRVTDLLEGQNHRPDRKIRQQRPTTRAFFSPRAIAARDRHARSPHAIAMRDHHTRSPREIATRDRHPRSPPAIAMRDHHARSPHAITTSDHHARSPHAITTRERRNSERQPHS